MRVGEETRAYIRLYLRVHWGTTSVHSQQNMSCTVIPGRETEASERYGRTAPHQNTTGVSDYSKGWQLSSLAANSRSLWSLKCEKSWDTDVYCRESAHKVSKLVSFRVWRLGGVEDGWEWKVLSAWGENLTSSSSTHLKKKKYVGRYV